MTTKRQRLKLKGGLSCTVPGVVTTAANGYPLPILFAMVTGKKSNQVIVL